MSTSLIEDEFLLHLGDRVPDARVPHDRTVTVVLDVRCGCHVLDAAALLDYLLEGSITSEVKRQQQASSVMPCPKDPVLPIHPKTPKGRSSSSNVTAR